ncbi:MAG: mechanosensitive ion channel family protein, partial [Sandaracinaceae bacterium]|nr:mechanosensitive ion channel family protein [Sandaracinaceae bacterium]
RLRRPLPRRGLAPRVLSVLLALARLLPDWMRPAVLLALAAASVAAGWAAWVIVPDLIAALVIVTERRVRVGDWLEADRFAGVVEQIGARTTLLRAEDGAELVVPNRLLVRSALVSRDRRFHEVVARLRAPAGAPAPRLRSAIRDAVLCSAYVPAHPRLRIERDPLEPDVWRIRVRLLDAKLAGTFEGELRERVEEVLALDEGEQGRSGQAPAEE